MARTPRGLELEVDPDFRERLRVDVLRDDVVRLKMSRSQRFDETPTFAVSADLEAAAVPAFGVEETDQHVRVRTAKLVLTVYKHPFRLDAHRADGSVIFESAGGADRRRAYATLNDEFLLTRRCQREDALLRVGREVRPLQPRGQRLHALEHGRAPPDRRRRGPWPRTGGRPARRPAQHGVRSLLRLHPVFLPPAPARRSAMAGFFIDNPYRARFDFVEDEDFHVRFQAGNTPNTFSPDRGCRDILAAYTALTGRMAAAAALGAGLSPMPLVRLHAGNLVRLGAGTARNGFPATACGWTSTTCDGYRVFTWNPETFPDPQAMLAALREQGFRVITIIDPGVKYEPGYPVFDEAREKDLLCRTEAGEIYVGPGVAGPHRVPGFLPPTTREWWGRLNAEHVQSGLAGIWNDMNEPATGDIPHDAMRFRRRQAAARALSQPVRHCSWRWARSRGCSPRCRTGARSSCPGPGRPASSVTPRTGWAITARAGSTCG